MDNPLPTLLQQAQFDICRLSIPVTDGTDNAGTFVGLFKDLTVTMYTHARTHARTHTHTHICLTAFVRDNPGRPLPEETLTHSHPTWSSDILYYLPPFTTIHGILFVHFTCLTILSGNLLPGPLWSSSWPWTLNFILHTFLHPIITIFSQHTPIPTQPVLLQNQCYVNYT